MHKENTKMDISRLPKDITNVVSKALDEDIGQGDITAQLIPADAVANAKVLCREQAIVCGAPWVKEVFRQVDHRVNVECLLQDGDAVRANQIVLNLSGPARSLLTGERCALNFLQTLSATATTSRYYADLVKHTAVKLLDTRKTLPGLRTAQKYAVTHGGCFNHRMGLFDAFLIKENHIAACGSVTKAVAIAKQLKTGKTVEVEVENLEQLQEAIKAGADIIMLDNFQLDALQKAVSLSRGKAKLEASGGINKDTIVAVAETGVDFISLGTLTKDCHSVDLSMRFT